MFRSEILFPLDADRLRAWSIGASAAEQQLMDTYLSEANFFAGVLEPEIARLTDSSRVLEIGSGIGLLSRLIAGRGHTVVTFEPEAAGFASMASLSKTVESCWKGVSPVVETIPEAFDLNRVSGSFDLVIAINVIEHVPNPSLLVAQASSLLRPGGRGRFICPNYAFPYEPHFGFPTLFGKAATGKVMRRRIHGSSLLDPEEFWSNLSWPTLIKLRRELSRRGVQHKFSRDGLLSYSKRLADPQFLARKGNFFGFVAAQSMKPLELALRITPLMIAPIIDLTTYGVRSESLSN